YLQAAFTESWLEATGTLLGGDDYFPALETQGKISAQMVEFAYRRWVLKIKTLFAFYFRVQKNVIGVEMLFSFFFNNFRSPAESDGPWRACSCPGSWQNRP